MFWIILLQLVLFTFKKGFYCDSGNLVITTVRKFLTRLNLTQLERTYAQSALFMHNSQIYNEKKLNGIFSLRAKYIVKKISEEELLTIYQMKWSQRRENYRKFNINQKESGESDLTFYSLIPQTFIML